MRLRVLCSVPLFIGCAVAMHGQPLRAQVPTTGQLLFSDSGTSPSRIVPSVPAESERPGPAAHPLEQALQFAQARYDYLQQHVRDFTCLLVKRERIEGKLRGYEFLQTKARLRQVRDGNVTVPLSVYMHFLAPAQLKDRKVLYVEGQNGGKMLVRNGGKRFSYVTVRLAPDSDAALRESRYPVTELSLETVARRMIEKAEDDIRYDPDCRNTLVTFFRNASVDGRKCTRIQVVHADRDTNFSFHIANVYIDDQLNVPIRVEGYDWPEAGSTEPVLLEEYTFTRLRLNVGLKSSDFSPSLIEN